MRRLVLLVAVLGLAVAFSITSASADQVYHSEHIALAPVNDAPLRSGFVENIHANGPTVYANERYVLNGATPAATFDVVLNITTSGDTCEAVPDLALPSVSFTTNDAGAGVGMVTFTPDQADGLRGATVHIEWTLSSGSSVVYETACTEVTLD